LFAPKIGRQLREEAANQKFFSISVEFVAEGRFLSVKLPYRANEVRITCVSEWDQGTLPSPSLTF